MRLYRILAAVVTALLITGNAAGYAGEPRKDERTRTRLKEQNRRLQEMVDSLQMEIERYRNELHYSDSIANEMMAVYEVSEEKVQPD